MTVPEMIADVVLVEDEERAQSGPRQRLARAPEPIGVQSAEIHALLEIHLHVTRGLERAVPAMTRVHIVERDGRGRQCSIPRAICTSP